MPFGTPTCHIQPVPDGPDPCDGSSRATPAASESITKHARMPQAGIRGKMDNESITDYPSLALDHAYPFVANRFSCIADKAVDYSSTRGNCR